MPYYYEITWYGQRICFIIVECVSFDNQCKEMCMLLNYACVQGESRLSKTSVRYLFAICLCQILPQLAAFVILNLCMIDTVVNR